MKPWLIRVVSALRDSLLPSESVKDLNWPIRRTVVDVTVEFDRLGDDELHRIMTSGPKRWDATSTTAGVLVEADSSGVKLP